MKRSLTAFAILACMAAAAHGATYFTSNPMVDSGTSGATLGNGSYYGFCTGLNYASGSSYASTVDEGGQAATLPDSVYLESLTLYGRGSGSSNYASPVKVAICEYVGDGQAGGLLALSTNAVVSNTGGQMEFLFNFDALPTTSRIQVFFVKDTTDTATWDWSTDVIDAAYGIQVGRYGSTTLPQGFGTYKNGTANSWESNYIPLYSFKTTDTGAIPEPSTAAVSLLGLMGLALRRRRG